MKNIILHIACFATSICFSQNINYESYYNLCNEAEFNVVLNKKNLAWEQYSEAWTEFFPNIINLNKAISLGEELSSENKTYEFQLSLLLLFKDFFFGDNMLTKKISLEDKHNLIEFFPYLKDSDFEYMNGSKINNIIQLSNLLFLDQGIRKVKDNECKDSLITSVDKKIYSDFLIYLKVNGYPSQREYGMYSIYPHFLLLHNTVYHGVTEEINTILLEQIKLGNYYPSQYARLIDRYKTWILHEPQVYGE